MFRECGRHSSMTLSTYSGRDTSLPVESRRTIQNTMSTLAALLRMYRRISTVTGLSGLTTSPVASAPGSPMHTLTPGCIATPRLVPHFVLNCAQPTPPPMVCRLERWSYS